MRSFLAPEFIGLLGDDDRLRVIDFGERTRKGLAFQVQFIGIFRGGLRTKNTLGYIQVARAGPKVGRGIGTARLTRCS